MLKGNLPRIVFIFACVVCASLSMAACVPKAIRPSSKVVIKRVDISEQANNNNPVALDLVLVQNKKLYKELMKISAAEWFEKRNEYKLTYPKEVGLNAGSWEWVPGQVVQLEPIAYKYKVAGALVFANYLTPGAHRAVVNPGKPIVITLGTEDISVKSEK